jgi:hydrogenase maturation factor
MFPGRLAERFGSAFARRAERLFYKLSVVEDALTAVSVGTRSRGVTAMHDATECGVWGGLYEMAQAGGFGVRVEKERIPVLPCVPEICGLFGIDPFKSISEGTLIVMCRPHRAGVLLRALARRRIPAADVGEVTRKGMVLVESGQEKPLEHPVVDPFWQAFYNALKHG